MRPRLRHLQSVSLGLHVLAVLCEELHELAVRDGAVAVPVNDLEEQQKAVLWSPMSGKECQPTRILFKLKFIRLAVELRLESASGARNSSVPVLVRHL